jgi:peptide deformylase
MPLQDPLSRLLSVGAPALEQPALAVVWPDAALTQETATLHAALGAFRVRHGFGRAIAAPQLGIRKRFIAVNLNGRCTTLINPRITWRSTATFEVWDDCMSVPDVEVRVRRNCSVSVTFVNASGAPELWNQLPADTSELLQHEVDHLDGILMLSRAVGTSSMRSRRSQARAL